MEPPTYLAKKFAHERDSHIHFDEGPHIYTIDGDSDFMSVTTWNHSHFGHFDADAIITKMMASRNWPNSKYFGQTREEIKALWNKNGKEASEAGTKMHYDIECYYNDLDVEIDEDCVEFDVKFDKSKKLDIIYNGSNQDTLFGVLPFHNVLLADGTILPSAS